MHDPQGPEDIIESAIILQYHPFFVVPCAQQSRLEKDSGDLGIRIFPGNTPRNFEVEINRVSILRNVDTGT